MLLIDNPTSPYAGKVRITLYEKGLEPERLEILGTGDREALRRRNPRAEVPALEDGDVAIYDSSVICDYLEETHPEPPLLPAEPAERARCRLLERFADGPLDACLFLLSTAKLMRQEVAEKHPAAIAEAEKTLRGHFAWLDGELAGREWLCGAFSRADIAVAPHLGIAAFMGYAPADGQTALRAWVARMGERPSYQRVTREALAAFQDAQSRDDSIFDPAHTHLRDHRIEWLVRLGLGGWLLDELAAGKVFFSDPH